MNYQTFRKIYILIIVQFKLKLNKELFYSYNLFIQNTVENKNTKEYNLIKLHGKPEYKESLKK